VYLSEDGKEDVSKFTETMLHCIGRYAQRFRADHFGRGRSPMLVCPGMKLHPGNILIFEDENSNALDQWKDRYYVPFSDLDEERKFSLKKLVVSEQKLFVMIFISSYSHASFFLAF
jgi:hypothetical protein